LLCSFFRWVALRFREITYAKKGTFPSGIFLSNAKQKKPFVLLDNNRVKNQLKKKTTGSNLRFGTWSSPEYPDKLERPRRHEAIVSREMADLSGRQRKYVVSSLT